MTWLSFAFNLTDYKAGWHMLETPKGLRLHIGLFGRRNSGKSTLMNALIGQSISIVSDQPGTTTDPVEKTMELSPLGPVVFVDTAGFDDVGELGALRVGKSRAVLERVDVGLVVVGAEGLGPFEHEIIDALRAGGTPLLVVFNKSDLARPVAETLARLEEQGIDSVIAVAGCGEGIERVKEGLFRQVPDACLVDPPFVGDLVSSGDTVVLVVPIDLGAPKGRLILPQVHALRDLLDHDALALIVKESELAAALARLNTPPRLVVCDSQVVQRVAAETPPEVRMTTFSILMARIKGDMLGLAAGAGALSRLKPGDRVLIAEACTHHPREDDIGRVKIPRWLAHYAGGALDIDVRAGKDFPEDLTPYALVVQCGGCTVTRKQILVRQYRAARQRVPMTNYGMAISVSQGVIERALECFPAALEAYRRGVAGCGGGVCMSVAASVRKNIAVVPAVVGAMTPMSSARAKPDAPFSAEARMLAACLDCGRPNRELLHRILAAQTADEVEVIRRAAERTLLEHCGDTVRLRGLIEFSNRCTSDCYYCGIRRSNRAPTRYTLRREEIVETARWCAGQGYGSVVLQSGERRDARFVRFVADTVRAIKAATQSDALPQGVGITLCVGEQSPEAYAEWFAAGAHRYLLRMETSSPSLFAALHPAGQRYASRVECLRSLKSIGYRLGTGVMIGLPGQTLDDLVDDLLFFRDIGADMIGMGPYIPHAQAVLPGTIPDVTTRMTLALRMIAATRLLLPSINIAATTALQTLAPDGREQGLRYGANVIMPQATPLKYRRDYALYDGKPCLDDSAGQCASCLENRITSVGRRILRNAWGDPAAARPPG